MFVADSSFDSNEHYLMEGGHNGFNEWLKEEMYNSATV